MRIWPEQTTEAAAGDGDVRLWEDTLLQLRPDVLTVKQEDTRDVSCETNRTSQ